MTRYHLTDSSSDGMCGSVTVRDSETGREAKRRWSVSSPQLDSPERAREAAEHDLRGRAIDDRVAHRVRMEARRSFVASHADEQQGDGFTEPCDDLDRWED